MYAFAIARSRMAALMVKLNRKRERQTSVCGTYIIHTHIYIYIYVHCSLVSPVLPLYISYSRLFSTLPFFLSGQFYIPDYLYIYISTIYTCCMIYLSNANLNNWGKVWKRQWKIYFTPYSHILYYVTVRNFIFLHGWKKLLANFSHHVQCRNACGVYWGACCADDFTAMHIVYTAVKSL